MRLGARWGDFAARGLLGVTRTLWGVEKVVTGFVEEAAPTLLGEAGRRAFVDRIWERVGVSATEDPLFAWEEAWFKSDLPPPPARVLLGGAGRGREARWLAREGYEVVAFEPVEAFLESLRGAGVAHAEVLSYEGVADGRGEQIWQRAPYDAFLLGWGSFSCVLEPSDRSGVLEAGRALTPEGPILLSYLRLSSATGGARALGRSLARVVGFGWARPEHARRDRLYAHLGFIHPLDEDELDDLAARTGNSVRRAPTHGFEYPHATLLPTSERYVRKGATDQSGSSGTKTVSPGRR